MSTRATGVKGHVVNTTTLQELTNLPETPWPLLSLTLADGRMALVCIEGVGWCANDGLILVPTDTTEQTFPVDLVRQAVTEDTLDLSIFIRTFGARLETNFWLWFHEVKGKGTP